MQSYKILLTILGMIWSGGGITQTFASSSKMELVESAVPFMKRAAVYVDNEVIDSGIITYCTVVGASLGHEASLRGLSMYYRAAINPQLRMEDDIGWWFGLYVGNQTGKFFVKLRHKVTDPLFPAAYKLVVSVGTATKIYLEEKADSLGGYIHQKLTSTQNYFDGYAHAKRD